MRASALLSVVVVVLAVALASAGSAAETVLCSTRRLTPANGIQLERSERDGLGGQRRFSIARLDWLVRPASISADAPAWLDDILAEHETLLEIQLPKLEIGAVTGARSDSCQSERLMLHWYDTTYAPTFAELPIACNDRMPQQFGLDSHSPEPWGYEARSVRDGRVYAPSGGRQSMESIVGRANSRSATLAVRSAQRGGGYYPLLGLTYRSCVVADVAAIERAFAERLANESLLLTRTAKRSGEGETTTAGAGATPSGPALWPIRTKCLVERKSGSCDAWFGYVYVA